jgi:hypothetical protein
MDITRNQVFCAGLLLLLLGLQFYVTDYVVLTPQATKMLAEQGKHPVATAGNSVEALMGAQPPTPSMTIRLPDWLGWFLMSMGTVFILHSWTMARPA